MYNDEKKLITDIQRRKDLDKNLRNFANVAFKADFEYACHKFVLNYLTLKDMHQDGDIPDDSYIASCQSVLDKLAAVIVSSDSDTDVTEYINTISDVRNAITHKMKVLTAYTDAFETYEYILNRKEYGFPENLTEGVTAELEKIDADEFADEIFRFVFADNDKVAVNSKLQSIVGQLPIRMTKSRFYDILGDTLDIYKDVEIDVLDEFIEMLESTALIRKPDNFENEYPDLNKAYELLKNGNYTELDYTAYAELADILDKSAAFLNSVVTEYMLIIELVNDMYVMLLSISVRDSVSEGCKKAISVIDKAVSLGEDGLEEVYGLLENIVGEQERAGEHKIMLESAVYDITTGYGPEITANGLTEAYRSLEKIDKLLSGSMFVDIDNVEVKGAVKADKDYIAACKSRLADEFAELFEGRSMTVNRAVMAKILSGIPVFFNTTDEIKDYIHGSLSRCREQSELLADYIVIKQMIEE